MSKSLLIICLFFIIISVSAEAQILKPDYINYPMDSVAKIEFDKQLESFFINISNGHIMDTDLSSKNRELTKSQLQELVRYESGKDSATVKLADKQLINIYPISKDKYFISMAYVKVGPESYPVFYYKIDLIAAKENEKLTFSIPLDYLTRYWKSKTIGNTTYHFRDSINVFRAKNFDLKNTEIATKMGLKPEKFDFYMCDNFQEISTLLGFGYSAYSNGKYRDGYGVDANTIFAIENNEDFSHDIFHYYSGKVNERGDRNWITEEGIAYLWGNAYYTDKSNEMVTHERLVKELKIYISQNTGVDLYELFSNNIRIYNEIAPEISIRSVISGIIAKEVESKKGEYGILALINAGSKDRLVNYMKATDDLIGINTKNFNERIQSLIKEYQ
jgi:hypothetical protein